MTTDTKPTSENFPVTVLAQYIKDFSFESPNAPQIFAPSQAAPEIQMNVNLNTKSVGQNNYEVALTLKLEARIEGKVGFIAELTYAGVFVVPPMPEDHLKLFLLVEAPRVLFPFARSSMTNNIRDGGFPYVMIQPVDFMSLFIANKNNVGSMSAVGAA